MPGRKKRSILPILSIIILIGYFASGIYSLQSGQSALILRFGKVVNEVIDSGIHYHLPAPVERAIKVHVSEVQTVSIQEKKNDSVGSFTGDENLIIINAIVGYDVKNLIYFLFKALDVKSIIKNTGQKCLCEELAKMTVDEVMTSGKSILRLVVKNRLQKELDALHTGVRIISVELTDISPPLIVSSAFQAVSDARVKKQEIIREAEGYSNSVIPEARGNASVIISRAEIYANEVNNYANARVKAFDDLLVEFKRNPEITAQLMYLETMQKVYNISRVSIDTDPSQSIYYIEREGK